MGDVMRQEADAEEAKAATRRKEERRVREREEAEVKLRESHRSGELLDQLLEEQRSAIDKEVVTLRKEVDLLQASLKEKRAVRHITHPPYSPRSCALDSRDHVHLIAEIMCT